MTDSIAVSDSIAVTVIGGYLGAGKTTLVNHILRTADERVAVVVNDFGDIDIDAELIESQDGDTISLANGCICCSLVDGLASALTTIKELDPRPERLVIEASGVADPATVAAYGHSPGLVLDAVVVMTDAETVRQRSVDRYVGDTVLGQLQSADIVVLNKVDLIDTDQAAATRVWLREHSPKAVVVDAEHSQVSSAVLFGRITDHGPTPAGGAAHDHGDHDHGDHDHADHDHGDHGGEVFQSWSWSSDEPIERSMIEALMAQLPDGIVRAKGVLSLSDEPERSMTLQRVGRRWTLRPHAARSGQPGSRIVLIGLREAIDDDWLGQVLSQCR